MHAWMMGPTLLGGKRAREEPCAYERSVNCRIDTPLFCRALSDMMEAEDTAEKCFSSQRPGDGGLRVALSRRNVNSLRTGNSASCSERSLVAPPRRVEVDVSRGDTGRRYRFTFDVPPPPGLCCGGEKSRAASVAYRNCVVSGLLSRVRVETGLLADHVWVPVCQGKNILCDAGANLLMSRLLSESCQRITLAIFYTLTAH